MHRPLLTAFLLLAVLSTVACGGGEAPTGATASAEEAAPTETGGSATDAEPAETTESVEASELPLGHVLIEKRGGGEPVSVAVEVAEEPEHQQRGLMFRESLPPGHGMIFVFGSEQTGGFWMKNTLIPLSIAFYGENGRILKILDMEPCEADPCPVYDPEVAYVGALEVNRGAFARWGVAPGDRIVLHRL